MKKFLGIITILAIVLFAAYYFYCNFTYSEGSRAGYLVKVSKKGMVFKTLEGQMNLGGVNGGGDDMSAIVAKDYWEFSVPTDREDIFEELQNMEGKHIKVNYKQKISSFFWQGETDYFVDDVELVNNKPQITN